MAMATAVSSSLAAGVIDAIFISPLMDAGRGVKNYWVKQSNGLLVNGTALIHTLQARAFSGFAGFKLS
jgi:hypothetical protein